MREYGILQINNSMLQSSSYNENMKFEIILLSNLEETQHCIKFSLIV